MAEPGQHMWGEIRWMGNRPGEFSRRSTLGFCRTLNFPDAPTFEKDLHYHYHYHYHAQRAPMAPPQGVPTEWPVTNRADGVLQHGFKGSIPLFSVTLRWCHSTQKLAQ
jgi:hypothetical protein